MKYDLNQSEKYLIALKDDNYKRYQKLFRMIDDKNIYELPV